MQTVLSGEIGIAAGALMDREASRSETFAMRIGEDEIGLLVGRLPPRAEADRQASQRGRKARCVNFWSMLMIHPENRLSTDIPR